MDEAEARRDELLQQLHELKRHQRLSVVYSSLEHPEAPYHWQQDFHNSPRPQKGIIAGNQTGKTRTISAEVACHALGWYPEWWKGVRIDHAAEYIVAGTTVKDVRDIQQAALFGPMKEGEKAPSGRGWIPRASIGDWTWQLGVQNVLDYCKVRHRTGEWSTINFKSFEQGAVKFQGRTIDGAIWLDEEPEKENEDIFDECLARLVAGGGMFLFSRTPLFGRTKIVKHFLSDNPHVFCVRATWDDAPHLSQAKRDELVSSFSAYQVKTRTGGVPMLGTGGLYPIPDDDIMVDPLPIPPHWRRIAGLDFGIEHPTAGAWLAWDELTDTVYLYDEYRQTGETPVYHAQAFKGRGAWIPVAWPHDGLTRDKGSGIPLVDQYRKHGVNALAVPAQWEAEVQAERGVHAQSREAAVLEIFERMRTGRFKVFSHCRQFLEEKNGLHRKDGKIVAEDDDIESAIRYALMMLRYSVSDEVEEVDLKQTEYDPLGDFSTTRR
jgi:phage terminase large subunit-like protein